MRPIAHLLLLLACSAALTAQGRTGRHFQRDTRLSATPAATSHPGTAEASSHAPAPTPAPLAKLRSGRPWPSFHYSRLPAEPVHAGGDVQAVDAAARRSPAAKRGFWRAHG
jgi:hypothetical protein